MNSTNSPSGAELILAERKRQVTGEGFTAEHDLTHDRNELTRAAMAYLRSALEPRGATRGRVGYHVVGWPFEPDTWKPEDTPIRDLVKAGALIAAEIDRQLAGGLP